MLLVSEKGKIYRVEEIQFREYGVALNLKNMVTNKLAWVTIHNDRLDVKLWRSARSEGEGNGNG